LAQRVQENRKQEREFEIQRRLYKRENPDAS
jgi:hypothetical protein